MVSMTTGREVLFTRTTGSLFHVATTLIAKDSFLMFVLAYCDGMFFAPVFTGSIQNNYKIIFLQVVSSWRTTSRKNEGSGPASLFNKKGTASG